MAQQAFGVRFGKPDVDSIVVVGCSLSAGDITISLNGQPHTISLSPIGTDAPSGHPFFGLQAGFVGSIEITGLSPYTKYPYVATKGGAVLVVDGEENPLYTWTAPEIDDDFILIPITCDNNARLGGDPAGGYTQVKAIAEANPDKGVYFYHVDDHYGYMDGCSLDDSAGTGHFVSGATAQATGLVYDYCINAFASFGFYTDAALLQGLWGQNTDRQWCMYNIPVLPVKGDHDSGTNDMGQIHDPTDAVTDLGGGVTPKDKYDNSLTVWNAFLAPFQGDNMFAGTQAWSHTLGCVKLISMDGIAKGDGTAEAGGDEWVKAGQVYHPDQITAAIAAADDLTVPFKIFGMTNGIRYLDENAPSGPERFGSGSQYPQGGNESFTTTVPGTGIVATAEYAQLMTDAGGLMDKASCNGKMGVMFTVHGDWHAFKVMQNRNTAGTNDEWFYSIGVGTINGSVNFDAENLVSVGDVIDGSTVKAIEGRFDGTGRWWVVPLYVYGSRPIKEIEVYAYNKTDTLLISGKFTERSMNEFIPITTNVNASGSGPDSGGIL